MPVVRCSDQPHQSLREHYNPKGETNERVILSHQLMISLIDKLDEIFKDTIVFGLTSHYHLNLLAYDSFQTDWFVTFIAGSDGEVYVECLLPRNKQPWPFAKVTGQAETPEEGIKYILLAMKESEGWQDNKELETCLKNLDNVRQIN